MKKGLLIFVFPKIFFSTFSRKVRFASSDAKSNVFVESMFKSNFNKRFFAFFIAYCRPTFPSYRNQYIDYHFRSVDWFLYEGNVRLK